LRPRVARWIPTARTVTLARGIPSVKNTPALDPVLMSDGRQENLLTQALGARPYRLATAHPRRVPTLSANQDIPHAA
jgi:hypothetical protein